MSRIRESQEIHISSYKSSWNESFRLEHDFDHVCVLSASIPKSWYLIQKDYNTFTLTELLQTGGTSSVVITLPAGNYNVNTFMLAVKTALNAASPNHWTYDITFANLIGKYTFTVKDTEGKTPTNQPSFAVSDNVNEQLGFPANQTAVFVNGSLTSQNVVTFEHEPTLFLHSSLVGLDHATNVLQHFFSHGQDYSSITWNATDVEASSKKISQTQSASFALTDENGHEVDLNGLNIVLVLLFWKKDDIFDMLRDIWSSIGKKIIEKLWGRQNMSLENEEKDNFEII